MTNCPAIQFQFFDKLGQRINVPQDMIISASWVRTVNKVGKAVLTIPSDCTDITFATLRQEDLGLLINVAQQEGQAMTNDLQTYWFLRQIRETNTDGKGQYKLTFRDANHLLERRVVAYHADDPEGSSPNAIVSGEPGNVALRRIFDTNFGSLAGIRDLTPYVDSSGIVAPSVVIDKEISYHNVLRTLQQICRTSRDSGDPLFFDLVALPTATDVRFQFRTYRGQRGSYTGTTISTENPYFSLESFELDYDIPNVGYVAGIGRGQDRQIATASNSRSTSGRYTRFEEFKSVRSSFLSVLEDEARNLVNNNFGVVRLEGLLLGDLSFQFDFGDRLTANHRGFEVECEIDSISSSYALQEYTRSVIIKSVGT